MIIQCEQCQTKFKLDDSKVADKGIKVRCARCKHVFPVAPAPSAAEETASFWPDETGLVTEAEQEAPELEMATDFEPETEEPAAGESGLLDTFSFDTEEEQPEAEAAPPVEEESDFIFPSAEAAEPVMEEEGTIADDLDFGDFDFGDDAGEPETGQMAAEPLQQAAEKKEVSGLDFSDDDMFGEIASDSASEDDADALSFDMGMDDFSDSMSSDNTSTGQSIAHSAQDKATETPFSLDDIDFGDEMTSVAVQQVSPEELNPSKDQLFAPIAAAEPQFSADRFDAAPMSAPLQEEAAPAPVSRLKEKPRISGMLLFLWVMICALVVFYGYWGYKTMTENKEGSAEVQDAGKISLRSVEATYIKNKKLGSLLMITGEAVNDYSKPRAAIQVKGIIFGAKGEEVASKIAFCGNPLTEEQLASMPMDKIEAAMANQFGDSLANMEVAPGDSIPFVIIIPKPPAGATDYGVEPAGSTVAAGKDTGKDK